MRIQEVPHTRVVPHRPDIHQPPLARRYNDRPANHDGLGNDGSLLLDNDRRRTPVLVSMPLIAWSFLYEVTGRSAATAGEARASALAAPKIVLRMYVVPLFVALVASKRGNPLLGP
jgi:hypothetical protein